MDKLTIAKFGGSAIGINGESIPVIVQRIRELTREARVLAVFSAPLTIIDDKKRSLTDVVLEMGKMAENGKEPDLGRVRHTYDEILKLVSPELRDQCQKTIDAHLKMTAEALVQTKNTSSFTDEIRSQALGFSGELLTSHVMYYILRSNDISAAVIDFEHWPIVTDNNIESTNFLTSKSQERLEHTERLVMENKVVCMGGFIGLTQDDIMTTFERGGTDRTAADMGILFHKKYQCRIDFEKDSAVVSADPKIVTADLTPVHKLSYNEARFAGMFGMQILDPIAIKEILENGVDLPIIITDMKNPQKTTIIERSPEDDHSHPLKIVTGKKNCAIVRMEQDSAQNLLLSLEKDKRYSEYIILSPFTRDGIEFTRILFLDADYVKRNEKYLLGFDSLASITYNRGVITLIGDQMWRVQQIVSKISAKIGDAGLNILNMDAQEETSRIVIVMEDSGDNIAKAIEAVHSERSKIQFI